MTQTTISLIQGFDKYSATMSYSCTPFPLSTGSKNIWQSIALVLSGQVL